MHDFTDSKLMAKALRQALSERGVSVSHSDALELVARQFGFANWNMLAARIDDSARPPLPLPQGWFVSHPNPQLHRIGLDPKQPGVALVETLPDVEPADHTGVLMQSIGADAWRGQVVRLSAELQTEAAGSGSLWMRVDPAGGRALRFDNMLEDADRVLRGDRDWREVAIVLDVPPEAVSIHFGLLLVGKGKLRARKFRLEPVDDDTPTTGHSPFPLAPVNLDFGAGGRPVSRPNG